jgi:hypothetical protein
MITQLSLTELRKAERKVGLKAARLIKKSIIKEISAYNLNSNNATTLSLQNSVKSTVKMGKVRLFGIKTTMARHGFIIQHGVNDQRTGHTRQIQKTKTFYSVKEHGFQLTKKPFIQQGILKSGAFDVIFKGLGELRMNDVAVMFNKLDINLK